MKSYWKTVGICMLALSDGIRFSNGMGSNVSFLNDEFVRDYVNSRK